MATRADYESAVKHWKALDVGVISEKTYPAREGRASYRMATLERDCRLDEAIHLAGWMETQCLLAGDGAHYSRSVYRDVVMFRMHISRPLDEQDAIPQEVAHEA